MNVLPVSYKHPLNRIKGNRNVVNLFLRLNATLCWHIRDQIVDPWGAQGWMNISFVSSSWIRPLSTHLCSHVLELGSRGLPTRVNNFSMECCWRSQVKVACTQYKRTFLQPWNRFIDISPFSMATCNRVINSRKKNSSMACISRRLCKTGTGPCIRARLKSPGLEKPPFT